MNSQGRSVFAPSQSIPTPHYYVWQLTPKCQLTDLEQTGCLEGAFCADADDGILMEIEVQGVLQEGRQVPPAGPLGAPIAFAPPAEFDEVGQPYGRWYYVRDGCVQTDGLNLSPTPEEVLQVFTALPIPGLGFGYQPPDLGLVNLPEIFFTTEPTTGSYPVDIRGYSVTIATSVNQFIWHTGDTASPEGEAVVSGDPGAPYPNQTVTHTYLQRGTYPAYLETVWTATYTYDSNDPYAVPGSVTTTGPAQNIEVVEAHPVLTDPYD